MAGDHGLIGGLRDDDHPQYYNAARLSSWYGGQPPNAHTHVVADITDIGTYYSAVGHSHVEADITDLKSYSLSTHNHDGVYAPTHSHPYAATSHDHTESDITDLGNYSVVGHTHSYLPLSGGTISGSLTVTGTMDINEIYGDIGSQTDPSFTFDGYTTSGMYYSGASVVLTNAGTWRIQADGSGAQINGRLDVTSYVYSAKIAMSANGTVSAPVFTWWNDQDTGFWHQTTANYFAATAGGYIIQQWGWTGTNKEIYFYGLQTGSATNYVRYDGGSGHLQYSSSTLRVKKNIRPLEVGLTDNLRPSRFQFRRDDEITTEGMSVVERDWDKEQIGLIAEWTAEEIPEAGVFQEGLEQAVNYDDLAILAATVVDLQDARKRINALEREVAELRRAA